MYYTSVTLYEAFAYTPQMGKKKRYYELGPCLLLCQEAMSTARIGTLPVPGLGKSPRRRIQVKSLASLMEIFPGEASNCTDKCGEQQGDTENMNLEMNSEMNSFFRGSPSMFNHHKLIFKSIFSLTHSFSV